MEERRYTTTGRPTLVLSLLIPALIVVMLIIANTLVWDAGGTRRPPFWWSAFIGAFGLFYGVRTLLLAYVIRIHPDDRIEFRRLLGSVIALPSEVHAIRPSLIFQRFLHISCAGGPILVPIHWAGLHEFVEYIRRNSPGLMLKGLQPTAAQQRLTKHAKVRMARSPQHQRGAGWAMRGSMGTSRYVALIRGINVGRAKRVSMAALRDVMARLGYPDCRTLLNSGNVVFTGAGAASSIGSRIERAMETQLAISARVMVLSSSEFAAIMKEHALPKTADNPSRVLVAFVWDGADLVRLKVLEKQSWRPEVLAVGKHAAYLWCPGGVGKSPLIEAVGRVLGEGTTTRNWATVAKLHALL